MKRPLLALLLLATACQVDRQAVFNQVYACNPTATDPGCGTDRDDRPMMCFAGRPLGGTDFCSEQCNGSDEGGVCAQSGARLASCDPNVPNSCGNPKLGCFRNNVLQDGGVCVTINPCSADSDCVDPVRSRCASSFVSQIYQTTERFKNDHLWCLQADCQKRRSACSPGETCLRDVIPAAANPPDICVPSCDSNLHCPPAHFCYAKTSGPQAPAICIPGLLGFPCESTLDCMMGECLDTGAGSKNCSTHCVGDADCMKFDGQQGKFLCNQAGQCVAPDSYRGAPCKQDGDCKAGLSCALLMADSDQGTCQPLCDISGGCAARGGVPHTCLPARNHPMVCYPGYFGLPCASDAACLPGLSCRALGAGQPSVCSNLCADDGDCQKVRWSAGSVCKELPGMGIKVCVAKSST
jgi:hypothetical protein